MELKELMARNVSAALRETMNARLAALHIFRTDKTAADVLDKLLQAESMLETIGEIVRRMAMGLPS